MKVHLEKRNGQRIYTVTRGPEVLGYVVIDSLVAGRSCGGLRMLPDVDKEEMSGLARSMTLKYGFLGLPQGGAKAGVRGDPSAPGSVRRGQLKAFGSAIAELLRKRTYVPGNDMGTENEDIRYMLRSIGIFIKRRELRENYSGYYTARSVLAGLRQGTRYLGLRLQESTVAIEGFGKVGGALGGLLADVKARVVAISTSHGAIYDPRGLNVQKLRQLSLRDGSRMVETYDGAETIDRASLLELPVDILCPCARHDSVHLDNAANIKARIICPGANNPVTSEAEGILFERGVLCIPDFLANCGGVLGGTMEFASVKRVHIEALIDRDVGRSIAWVLDEAEKKRERPRRIAEATAFRRFQRMQRSALHPSVKDRIFGAALELYRRGYVPGPLVAILSMPYFRKLLK